ncbi:MAG: transcription antitermination factor NusB [Chloroflexota bacterium]
MGHSNNVKLPPEFDPEDVVSSEVIEPPAVTNENSQVRRVALQVLYEVDSAGHNVGDVITTQLDYNTLSDRGVLYLRELVTGVIDDRAMLDQVISRFAPEWPVDQIAIVDRNVLRIAVYEMAISRSVPVKVAIDEAVELAKLFGADGTARFVNGVLGAVADNRTTLNAIIREASGGHLPPLSTDDQLDDDDSLEDG